MSIGSIGYGWASDTLTSSEAPFPWLNRRNQLIVDIPDFSGISEMGWSLPSLNLQWMAGPHAPTWKQHVFQTTELMIVDGFPRMKHPL